MTLNFGLLVMGYVQGVGPNGGFFRTDPLPAMDYCYLLRYIYIYIYLCVRVCMCVCADEGGCFQVFANLAFLWGAPPVLN